MQNARLAANSNINFSNTLGIADIVVYNSAMKKLLNDAGGFQTFIEVRDITAPSHAGWKNLRITTLWLNSRNAPEEHVKMDINLDPAGLQQFKQVIQEL